MRTTALLSFVALAFGAFVDAKQAPAGGKAVCTTAACAQRGTRTSYVPDHTSTVIKEAPPCYTTTTTYITPKARTVTSITPYLSTTVVQAAQQTDTFTVTSVSYAVTVPTTTTTVTTVTPTVTATTVVPNPGVPSSTTVTSFTQVGPTPPAPPAPPTFPRAMARGAKDSSLDTRGSKKGMNSPAMQGKNVYCHQEFTETSTHTAPCRTVTSSSRLPQSTTTSISTLTIPVTSTSAPRDALTVVTVPGSSSTITATPITFTYTATASATTTTTTSTAPLATNTNVVSAFQDCQPDRFVQAANYEVDSFDGSGTIVQPDAFACCNFAAAMTGAIAFKFSTDGTCFYTTAASGHCPRPAAGFNDNGMIATFGLLQCATPSTT